MTWCAKQPESTVYTKTRNNTIERTSHSKPGIRYEKHWICIVIIEHVTHIYNHSRSAQTKTVTFTRSSRLRSVAASLKPRKSCGSKINIPYRRKFCWEKFSTQALKTYFRGLIFVMRPGYIIIVVYCPPRLLLQCPNCSTLLHQSCHGNMILDTTAVQCNTWNTGQSMLWRLITVAVL